MGSQTEGTPGMSPIPLTPAVSGGVFTSGVGVALGSDLVGSQTIPPIDVGPVHVCDPPPSSTCQSVPEPGIFTAGSMTIDATVGSQTEGQTVNLP